MEDSATATFIESFSASKLKGFDFFFPPSLSFFLSLDEKNDPDRDEDLVCPKDWTVWVGCGKVTGGRDEEAGGD